MAGMPKKVLDRANQVLAQLEGERDKGGSAHKKKDTRSSIQSMAANDNMQLSFFQLDDPVLENIKDELQKTDINTLTPVEALMKLNEIKKLIGG